MSVAPNGSTLPLAGICVLDLTRLLPGPYATMVLGDLGAEVWKVESPAGDATRWVPPVVGGEGALFLALNRNKRSIVLDLRQDSGRAALHRLAAAADVIVDSFRPGRAISLGLDSTRFPRAVFCSISGFGASGALAGRAGHDLGYEAWSGLLSVPNGADGRPALPATPIADLVGGAWPAVVGILAALFRRERTGVGGSVDASIRDGAVAALPVLFANLAGGRGEPSELTGGLPAYGVYRTADDRFVALSALEPSFWASFCQAVQRTEWVGLHLATGRQREQLFADLTTLFRSRSWREWREIAATTDCCLDPVLAPAEIVRETGAKERGLFDSIPVGSSSISLPASPIVLDGERLPMRLPPPTLGESTAEILAAAGHSGDEVRALDRAGITTPSGRMKRWLWGKIS